MTREEKAHSLGQECFPDGQNIWARPNYEARWVSGACMKMAEWENKRLVEKACKCYCDDICDKSRCGMCFHKHDGKYQIKNSFQYNECDVLKIIRKAMEE